MKTTKIIFFGIVLFSIIRSTGNILHAQPTGAQNGVSVDVSNNVVLGGTPGGVLGILLDEREVYLDANSIMFNSSQGTNASIGIGRPFGTLAINNRGKLDVLNDYHMVGGEFLSSVSLTTSEVFGVRATARNTGLSDAVGVNGISAGTASALAVGTGVRGNATTSSSLNIGIHGVANNGTIQTIGGLFEVAASSSGYNHGVMSLLTFSNYAAATNVGGEFSVYNNNNAFGTNIGGDFNVFNNAGGVNIGVRSTVPTATGGLGPDWAGYFGGDVFTTTGYYPSDRNLKKDITPIENSLDIINKLNPVHYSFDISKNPNMGLSTVKQWGFISQDVQQILPELTKQTTIKSIHDPEGKEIVSEIDVLTLNYNGFIAILTSAIQEQQKEIQEQQKEIDELKAMIGMTHPNNTTIDPNVNAQEIQLSYKEYVVLNQNVPNPFAEQTTISYNIPEIATDVQIVFYNTLGQIIKTVLVNDRGQGRLNVFADDLSSGIYSYSLIMDGKVIDTKKMIKK